MASIPIDSKNKEFYEKNQQEQIKDKIFNQEENEKDSYLSDLSESIIEPEEEDYNTNQEDEKDKVIEYQKKQKTKEKNALLIRQNIESVSVKQIKQGHLEVIILFCFFLMIFDF